MIICPECGCGDHAHCIGQGCECECVLLEVGLEIPEELECPHGLVLSMCEACEQEQR